MKKQSNLSRLLGYAGKHKILTYLSWILSVASALLALVPFWYIWRIIHDVLEAAPDFSQAESITGYGWMAVLVCGTLGCCLYCGSDVFSFKRIPDCVQYPQRSDAPYYKAAPWNGRKVRKRQTAQDSKYVRQRGGKLSCPQAA